MDHEYSDFPEFERAFRAACADVSAGLALDALNEASRRDRFAGSRIAQLGLASDYALAYRDDRGIEDAFFRELGRTRPEARPPLADFVRQAALDHARADVDLAADDLSIRATEALGDSLDKVAAGKKPSQDAAELIFERDGRAIGEMGAEELYALVIGDGRRDPIDLWNPVTGAYISVYNDLGSLSLFSAPIDDPRVLRAIKDSLGADDFRTSFYEQMLEGQRQPIYDSTEYYEANPSTYVREADAARPLVEGAALEGGYVVFSRESASAMARLALELSADEVREAQHRAGERLRGDAAARLAPKQQRHPRL